MIFVNTCKNSYSKNIREDGVNKKTIRFFDTLGSILALVALVLGICSLFIDQYDLVFTPEGFLKDAADTLKDFSKKVKPITDTLTKLIEAIDREFTCKEVYSAIGTGTALTLFASFFPGASSVTQVGTKSAYYGVRAANAFTNFGQETSKIKEHHLAVCKGCLHSPEVHHWQREEDPGDIEFHVP